MNDPEKFPLADVDPSEYSHAGIGELSGDLARANVKLPETVFPLVVRLPNVSAVHPVFRFTENPKDLPSSVIRTFESTKLPLDAVPLADQRPPTDATPTPGLPAPEPEPVEGGVPPLALPPPELPPGAGGVGLLGDGKSELPLPPPPPHPTSKLRAAANVEMK
jgi:hypothetical protein